MVLDHYADFQKQGARVSPKMDGERGGGENMSCQGVGISPNDKD